MIDFKEWMSDMPDDVLLSKLSLPGTHNTCALKGIGATCQEWSLEQQLNVGVRFLDIRARQIEDVFMIHHGQVFQDMKFTDVVAICKKFLQEHSRECIVMSLSDEHKPADNKRTYEEVARDYLDMYPGLWYTNPTIPKLSEVRGRIVLVRRFPIASGEYGLNFRDRNLFEIQDDAELPFIDSYDWKWERVRGAFEKARADSLSHKFHINFVSGYYLAVALPRIKPVADSLNPRLVPYLAQVAESDWSCTVLVDFVDGCVFAVNQIIARSRARFNMSSGLLRQLGNGSWANTAAMTSLNGALYVIQNGKLWRANPQDGQFEQLGGECWHSTAAMTSLDGSLYVIQNGKLWRANPQDGQFEQLGGEYWHKTAAMTSLNGSLYVIQNGKLWRANPQNGQFEQLGGEHWHNTAAMTSLDGALYVIQNGKLWCADPASGNFEQCGGEDWNHTNAVTSFNGLLYVIQNGKLWQADPKTGRYGQLHPQGWVDSKAMTSHEGRLYAIQADRLWQVTL